MMPKIAEGDANKVWVIPSEITKALEGLGSSIHEIAGIPQDATPRTRVDMGPSEPQLPQSSQGGSGSASKAVEEAIAAAASAAQPGTKGTSPGTADTPTESAPEDGPGGTPPA
jgi:hypothetical protein